MARSTQARVTVFAFAGALVGVVPIPILPRRMMRSIRGAMAHDVCTQHGLALTAEARDVLSEPAAGGTPPGIAKDALGLLQEPTSWLNAETPVTLFLGIAIAEIWRATAVVLIILVAGLQLIPKEYGEAAEIFGATPWIKFRKVTLPLLKPSLQSALILRTVLAFEVFAVVYALGGRNFPILVGEAYVWQRDNQNYGVAAAYAVLIMLISLAATVGWLRALRVRPEAQA